MLESCFNQAAGLQALALQTPPRLVALTSHGQQSCELPMLWSLCSHWVELGLSVVVLDGHAQESEQNPGLAQLLQNPKCHVNGSQDPVSWTVLAAAKGFEQLANQPCPTLALGPLFANYSLVLIYGNAQHTAKLLKDSDLSPLLLLAPLKASSLSAYQAIKQLLMDAQLQPTVANITLPSNANNIMTTHSPVQQLQHCAMTFLGYRIDPIRIRANQEDGRSDDDIHRLALQLLENAAPLERHLFAKGM